MNQPKPSFTSNPFRAAQLRPGTIAFVSQAGESPAQLVERFEQLGGAAQIVGAHGTGKSTLLHALQHEWASRQRPVVLIELRNGQRLLPHGWRQALVHPHEATTPGVLLVDGYEQLSCWSRMRLQRVCRRQGWNLLVTTHLSVGLPTLYETHVTPAIAAAVVRALQTAGPLHLASGELQTLLEQHRGNLREVLFELYDRYEHQQRVDSRSSLP